MKYFNAFFQHDLMNKDPEKRKKIKGIIFETGYCCKHDYECPHGRDCKYRARYKYHNWSVNVRNWIYHKTGIDIKFPWYFQRHRVDFSGTTMCPYKMPRMYNCYQCKHLGNVPQAEFGIGCTNDDYIHSSWEDCHDEDTPHGRCKFFEVDPYYENYDRKTGELPHER